MKPYYEDEFGIKSYQGDCLEILPELDILADIVITSPPYNVGIKYDTYKDNQPLPLFQEWIKERFIEVYLKTRDPGRLYLFCADKMSWWIKPIIEDIGWSYHQRLTWCKPNICGTTGKISGDWNYMAEDILLFHKGKRTPMLNEVREVNTFNWFVVPSCQSNFNDNHRLHPAQYPEDLIRKLIARTPGELILDPFAGVLTTLVAAKQLGREAIGIELSENYLQLGCERLSQTNFIKPKEKIEPVKMF